MDIISATPTPPDRPGSVDVGAIVELYRRLIADDRYHQSPQEARQAEILRLEADWHKA